MIRWYKLIMNGCSRSANSILYTLQENSFWGLISLDGSFGALETVLKRYISFEGWYLLIRSQHASGPL